MDIIFIFVLMEKILVMLQSIVILKVKAFYKNFIITCKDILYSAFYSKISIHKNEIFEFDYENIIVTWSEKKTI